MSQWKQFWKFQPKCARAGNTLPSASVSAGGKTHFYRKEWKGKGKNTTREFRNKSPGDPAWLIFQIYCAPAVLVDSTGMYEYLIIKINQINTAWLTQGWHNHTDSTGGCLGWQIVGGWQKQHSGQAGSLPVLSVCRQHTHAWSGWACHDASGGKNLCTGPGLTFLSYHTASQGQINA